MSHGLTSSIVKVEPKKANTAREALKRDANYTNASDDEKTGNSVNQLKRIGAYNNQWRHKLLLIQYESYCLQFLVRMTLKLMISPIKVLLNIKRIHFVK